MHSPPGRWKLKQGDDKDKFRRDEVCGWRYTASWGMHKYGRAHALPEHARKVGHTAVLPSIEARSQIGGWADAHELWGN